MGTQKEFKTKYQQFFICCTLRSGLHEIPAMIRTSPNGLENNHAWKWTFWQFSRNAYICTIPGKLPENHLHAWLFSNPCGQVLKSIQSRGQICPIPLRRKRTFPCGLENNQTCKWILDNFPGIMRMSAFVENCQKFICMYGCSEIHVNHCWNFMESGSESATYEIGWQYKTFVE